MIAGARIHFERVQIPYYQTVEDVIKEKGYVPMYSATSAYSRYENKRVKEGSLDEEDKSRGNIDSFSTNDTAWFDGFLTRRRARLNHFYYIFFQEKKRGPKAKRKSYVEAMPGPLGKAHNAYFVVDDMTNRILFIHHVKKVKGKSSHFSTLREILHEKMRREEITASFHVIKARINDKIVAYRGAPIHKRRNKEHQEAIIFGYVRDEGTKFDNLFIDEY